MNISGSHGRSSFSVGIAWFSLFVLLGWCATSRAEPPRILVVSSSEVPDDLEQSVMRGLSAIGELADPGAYLETARFRKLAPTSEEALTRLVTIARARLVVALEVERGKLHASFRDGASGEVLLEQTAPARGRRPKLSSRASRKLAMTARRALSRSPSRVASRSEPAASVEPTPQPRAADRPSTLARPTRAQPIASITVPQAAPAAAEPSDAEEDETPDESPSSEATDVKSTGDAFQVRASVGGGAGARTNEVPTRAGLSTTDTGFSLPALELGLGVRGMLSSHWLLGAQARYRMLLGAKASEISPATGLVTSSSVGSHSVVVGVAPGYRFGGENSSDLRLLLGWAYRTASAASPSLPSASTSGVVIRPELNFPFADGAVTLRIAPEVIVVVSATPSLAGNVAGLSSVGFAIGGEVSLDIRIVHPVYLGLEVRESRATVGSGWGRSYFDLERYAIGRLSVQL